MHAGPWAPAGGRSPWGRAGWLPAQEGTGIVCSWIPLRARPALCECPRAAAAPGLTGRRRTVRSCGVSEFVPPYMRGAVVKLLIECNRGLGLIDRPKAVSGDAALRCRHANGSDGPALVLSWSPCGRQPHAGAVPCGWVGGHLLLVNCSKGGGAAGTWRQPPRGSATCGPGPVLRGRHRRPGGTPWPHERRQDGSLVGTYRS